ncbi:thermonuclease family protein [Sphingorhabdus sp. EL138]|uniref:thermonuclease family protein n=1 Tax=Sphingorhabdus sp. EL138 TaxID=2073156 RepID=UPI000D69D9D5|nr:thermonuclease family protein [Sphingorhabdus sp. EL138]
MARKYFGKFGTTLLFLAVIGGAWVLMRWVNPAEIIVINGEQVSVIDGDSFRDADMEYRIYGIDAPEYRQSCKDAAGQDWPCGKQARAALEESLGAGDYSCDVHARDQYGRTIVTCISDDKDLGAHMVSEGHAISSDNFDQVIYGAEEAQAENAKRGIWQGTFEKPSSWRASHPR